MTSAGFVFQWWGNDVYEISCGGVTGYLRSFTTAYTVTTDKGIPVPSSEREEEELTPYSTPAYKALTALRKFYEEPDLTRASLDYIPTARLASDIDLLRIGMYYRRDLYVGHFLEYTFEETEESPWQWSYSFQFQADFHQSKGSGEWNEQALLNVVSTLSENNAAGTDSDYAEGVAQLRSTFGVGARPIARVSGSTIYLSGHIGYAGTKVRMSLVSSSEVLRGEVRGFSSSLGDMTGFIAGNQDVYTVINAEQPPPASFRTPGATVRVFIEHS